MTVVPKDDRTDIVQEERLGLPYWTMILAICVVVDVSKCLDTPILEFSVIWEHPPLLLGYKQILRQLLVLRNQAVWRWYPWSLLLSFVMLMILVQWILRKTLKSSFTISPRRTTRPLYFWCFASNSAFFRWQMSINDAKWTVAPDVLASSITSFLLLTFVRFHAEIFSNFPHSLSTASFALGIFIVLTVVDEMCFFLNAAQRQTSGFLTACEDPFARVSHAAKHSTTWQTSKALYRRVGNPQSWRPILYSVFVPLREHLDDRVRNIFVHAMAHKCGPQMFSDLIDINNTLFKDSKVVTAERHWFTAERRMVLWGCLSIAWTPGITTLCSRRTSMQITSMNLRSWQTKGYPRQQGDVQWAPARSRPCEKNKKDRAWKVLDRTNSANMAVNAMSCSILLKHLMDIRPNVTSIVSVTSSWRRRITPYFRVRSRWMPVDCSPVL